MPIIVHSAGGIDISDATANTNQVLTGYSFYSQNSDELQEGTMPNYGELNLNISIGEEHRDAGGYYSGIVISGPTLSGDAEVAEVLSGKTFYSNNGDIKTGTMTNYGDININIGVGGSETTNSAGYYSSITVKGPTLSGDAEETQVLDGKTFYSNSGTKKTGTMENKGSINTNIGVGGSYTNSAGYYSSITIKGPTLSGTATASQVLSGYTFYSNSGTILTGTLALSGNATVGQVLKGATFYNNSTTQYTGTLNNYYVSNQSITSSWQSRNIGFTPIAWGVAFNQSSDGGLRAKTYRTGMVVHWCLNGSGTYYGHICAIG